MTDSPYSYGDSVTAIFIPCRKISVSGADSGAESNGIVETITRDCFEEIAGEQRLTTAIGGSTLKHDAPVAPYLIVQSAAWHAYVIRRYWTASKEVLRQ